MAGGASEASAVTPEVHRELGARAAQSGVIRLSAQGALLVVHIAGGVVLARLLPPADFGLFAMGGVVAMLFANVRDFGFTMAAVHQENLRHREVSALFWVTVKLNLLAFAVMMLSAPALAWFFADARLSAIAVVLAMGTLAFGLAVQHESLLIRALSFGALRSIEIGTAVAGLALAIALALLGAGYWALVLQVAATQILRTAALWKVCAWRPAPPSRVGSPETRPLVSYAMHLTGYRVLVQAGRQFDRVLVASIGGAALAGLYANAARWAMMPILQVFPPLMAVAVAGLSRVQDDAATFRAAWRRGMLPVFSVVIPALVFLSVEAHGVIVVVLGDRWVDAVPLFRVLCIAALAVSFERMTKWLYLAEGTTQRQFRWGLVQAPAMIAAVAIGSRWGALGVAAGCALGAWLLVPPAIAYCLAGSRVGWRDVCAAVARPAAATTIASLALVAATPAYDPRRLAAHLILAAAVFTLAYLTAWVALPGGTRAARDALSILRSARLTTARHAPTDSEATYG